MREAAREAGLAKSNLYRYFATREEIFLALLAEDVEAWARRTEALVLALPHDPEPELLAHALVGGLTAEPRLVRLLGQLVSVLERNASVSAIIDFKLRVNAIAARQSAVIAGKLGWMSHEAALQLTHFVVALLQGLWPMHEPPSAVVEAMEHPDLRGTHLALEPALERGVAVLIRGLRAES